MISFISFFGGLALFLAVVFILARSVFNRPM